MAPTGRGVTGMTSELVQSLARVVEVLEGAGVHAVLDARSIVPPCAWVTLADVGRTTNLCGEPEVRASVCLIVGDFGTPIALEALGELLDKTLSVLDLEEPATPRTVTPPGMPPMPALVITTST